MYRHYTEYLDQILKEHEYGGQSLISFQEIIEKKRFYVPSFLLNEDENELRRQWRNQSVDEQRAFDRQRAGLIALRFLKMYCDRQMTEGHCDSLNTLKIKGVIPGKTDPHNWRVPDERDIVKELQPKGHALFDRIIDLLWTD